MSGNPAERIERSPRDALLRRRQETLGWTLFLAASVIGAFDLLAVADRQLHGRLFDILFAGSERKLRPLLDGSVIVQHLIWDFAFLAALVVTLFAFVKVLLAGRPPRWYLRLAAIPLVADITENALLLIASRDHAGLAPTITIVAIAKFVAYAILLLATAFAAIRHHRSPAPAAAEPPPAPPEPPCVGIWLPEKGTRGIACSGGGIRSAAFSLGALHGLGAERVRHARYLSGVSGGAYIAAAMTNVVRQGRRSGQPVEGLPFGFGSPELEKLRARSSYLFLAGSDGRIGIFRAIALVAFNLAVLWLIVIAFGRPLGWLMSWGQLHPELRAREPIVRSVDLEEDIRTRSPGVPGGSLDIRAAGDVDCPRSDIVGRRFLVRLVSPGLPDGVKVKFATTASSGKREEPIIGLLQRDGEVRVCGTEVAVTAHPVFDVDQTLLSGYDSRDPGDVDAPPIIEVARPLELRIRENGQVALGATSGPTDAPAPPVAPLENQLRAMITVDPQPAFTHNTGAAGREDINIDGWMLAVTIGPFLAGLLAVTAFHQGSTLGLRRGTPFLLVGVTLGALTIGVPWLLQSLPPLLARFVRALPGPADAGAGRGGGLLVWLTTLAAAGQAVRQLLSRSSSHQPGRARKASLFLPKALAFGLVVLAGTALAFRVLQQAALYGPAGRIAGLDFFWWSPKDETWLQVPDFGRWLLVVAVLVVLNRKLPAHRWSLLPLYRDRLARAFSLGVEPLQEEERLPPERMTTFKALADPRVDPWPELIICAAANLNDVDDRSRIPAGRWADTFTFSPTCIGGPTVGYIRTDEYYERLGPRFEKDLTLASVVAVAGAAFSPAMGKFAYGPIGAVFAVLNLRLGLWLPQPRRVKAKGSRWHSPPGWPYLVKELFGRYTRNSRFVYTTDGGHWENLGLVELLRRGCTEIYVLSAAGDGMPSLATTGEAIALARELFGVDIEVELSPLRPYVAHTPDPHERRRNSGRQLLRKRQGVPTAEPFAPAPFAVGRFTYPGPARLRGRVLFIEANLADGIPWDVQAWAEGSPSFPDDPTTDQFFDHRQFESYRRLGLFQANAGVNSAEWRRAGQWVEG